MQEQHPLVPGLTRAAILLFVGTLTTAIVYATILSTNFNITSDGQFATFFESGLYWSDLYAGGWPRYADPSSMAVYPLRYLFSAARESFDYFTLTAMVIFAVGNGALAFVQTRSMKVAAFAAALSPGIGFFVGHSSHTSILHASCYGPWVVLSCLKLSEGGNKASLWMPLLAIATALSFLAGHPQVSVYVLIAGAIFAAPASRRASDWFWTYGLCGAGVLLGIGLAAPLILATLNYLPDTARIAIVPEMLAQYSLRPSELGINLFPFLAGGGWSSDAGLVPYLGAVGNNTWTENLGYVGLCAPILAVVGWVGSRTAPQVKTAVVWALALVLALAPSFPSVAEYLVHVPVLGQFRAWARVQFLADMAAVQLAAFAVAKLLRRELSLAPMLRWCLPGIPLALGLASFGLFFHGVATAFASDSPLLSNTPLIQLGLATAMCICITIITRPSNGGGGLASKVILLICLIPILELACLAQYASFSHASATPPTKEQIDYVAAVKGRVLASHGRLLSMAGWESSHLAPDVARAARIPSLNWYGPLLNTRFADVSTMTSGGWINPGVLNADNQVLDIYGVTVVEAHTPDSDPRSVQAKAALLNPQRWYKVPSTVPSSQLYVNRRALPRTRLVGKSVALDDGATIMAIATSRLPNGDDFNARDSLVTAAGAPALSSTLSSTEATMDGDPNDGAFSVTFAPTVQPAFLVFGDNYSAGWRATLGNRPVAIERVNYSQMAVRLPTGSTLVRFEYRDAYLLRGLAIALICGLLLFGYFLWGQSTTMSRLLARRHP
jgi:hypothetical protein